MIKSINFVVLGDQSIAAEFGKKGTATDITLFDRKESDTIRTWIVPNGFPDKIQPLFQAINLAEYVILYVTSLDKFLGEQIIALNSLLKREGILSHSYDVDDSRLSSMIKDTAVERYKKCDSDKIKDELANLKSVSKEGKTKVVVDQCFDVKGVGTVVLGKVVSGKIKQYDTLKAYPSGKEVLIKSIQMHDDPVDEAGSSARVGLALKNVKPDDISRGDVLSSDDSLKTTSEIELDFQKNPFFRGEYAENQMCLVNIGLQIKPARFISVNPLKLKLEKPTVVDRGDIGVILKPEASPIRILGSGIIKQ